MATVIDSLGAVLAQPLNPQLELHLASQLALMDDAISQASSLGDNHWNSETQAQLATLITVSNFAREQFSRNPAWLSELLTSGDLASEYADGEYHNRLNKALAACDDEPSLHRQVLFSDTVHVSGNTGTCRTLQ